VLKQLKAYEQHLKPKRIALAVLTQLGEPSLRTGLRELGVDVYEELLDPEVQAVSARYVQEALKGGENVDEDKMTKEEHATKLI